eukprot:gene6744-7454_t
MKFVIDCFEEVALRSPNSPAIVSEEGSSITYGKLNERASTIAQRLVRLLHLDQVKVFEQTSMVGLLMERHIGIITMMLGIHKAGCAYVPVDPAFPPDRQAYILEHARCNVLIVDEECFEQAKKNNTPISAKHILISSQDGTIIGHLMDGRSVGEEAEESGEVVSEASLLHVRTLNHNMEALAYVLYTSGSTGKPKGVAVKQVGVDNIIHFFAEELHVSEKNRVLGLTTFCFDISVLEIFLPLTRGACFILALSSTRKDPFRILELMDAHEVNIFQATPTTYEMMLATGWVGDEKIHFLVGGEAFRPSLLPIAQKCASFLNVYGPTETTIWSTSFRVEKDFAAYAAKMGIKAMPIGKAISDTLLYLVGENQPWKEVAQGEEGELWIGGIGVAAGYLHAPNLTQERFIANPFGEGLVYRTGDVVKQLSDGNYIFVRRLDDQVKIDGFRIELEEIEKVYMENDHIEKAVALVRSNKLVLYILPTADTPVIKSSDEQGVVEYSLSAELLHSIHEQARSKLTYYMIPKYTVIIKDFAKTPNGKLDKKALPDPKDLQKAVAAVSPAADVTKALPADTVSSPALSDGTRPVSAVICEVIKALRGHRPSPSNNLGAFGLDSLGSVMLLRQLSNALHGEVTMRLDDLFVPGRTIRDLGKLLYDRCSPAAREKLHLISENEAENESWESQMECGEGGEASKDHFAHVPTIDYFGASLLANKRLIEGIRGVLAFMVLYDHWHGLNAELSDAILVDTTLFYILSGFTTASQVRSPPEIKKKSGLNGSEDEWKVTPQSPFQLAKFWLVRAVGLYPILWLTLILNAPTWYYQDKYVHPHHAPGLPQSSSSALCTFLHVIGMDLWGECMHSGPPLRYATNLINCMLFYGAYCFLWTEGLRRMTMLTSESEVCARSNGFTQVVPLRNSKQSWSQYLGNISLYWSRNLYHPEVSGPLSFFLVVLTVLLFWFNVKHNLRMASDFFYYLGGAWILYVAEMACGWRIAQTDYAAKGKNEEFPTPTNDVDRFVQWAKDNLAEIILPGLPQQVAPIALPSQEVTVRATTIFNAVVQADSSDDGSRSSSSDSSSSISEGLSWRGVLNGSLALAWRFLPDAIAVGAGMLISCKGGLCHKSTKAFLPYNIHLVLPCVFLAFVFVSIHQRERSRYNFSRLFLESDIMNFLGYASYPLYLLQNVMILYYMSYVSNGQYSYHPAHPSYNYYRSIPLKYRVGLMILFIMIAWTVQKVFQDYLVTNIFSKVLAWWSTRRNAMTNSHKHHYATIQ